LYQNKQRPILERLLGHTKKNYMHCISVISTLPYNAKDSLSENMKLDFVAVIFTLSQLFGNSPEYGLKRQLISSSCCPRSELYGYEEDQGNKKDQEELIDDNESEDAPVLNFKHTKSITTTKNKC
jgi:hypothetical protein